MRLLARAWAALFRFVRRLVGWKTPEPPTREVRLGEPGYISRSERIRMRRRLRARFPSASITTLIRRRGLAVERLLAAPGRKDLRRQLLELDVEIDQRYVQGF